MFSTFKRCNPSHLFHIKLMLIPLTKQQKQYCKYQSPSVTHIRQKVYLDNKFYHILGQIYVYLFKKKKHFEKKP